MPTEAGGYGTCNAANAQVVESCCPTPACAGATRFAVDEITGGAAPCPPPMFPWYPNPPPPPPPPPFPPFPTILTCHDDPTYTDAGWGCRDWAGWACRPGYGAIDTW